MSDAEILKSLSLTFFKIHGFLYSQMNGRGQIVKKKTIIVEKIKAKGTFMI